MGLSPGRQNGCGEGLRRHEGLLWKTQGEAFELNSLRETFWLREGFSIGILFTCHKSRNNGLGNNVPQAQ